MITFYQLPNYLDFLLNYRFQDSRSKQTAQSVLDYYRFAYYQMMNLSDTCDNFFNVQDPDHETMIEGMNKSWSYAYAMYALLRTSLEAMSIFRKMVNDQTVVNTYYKNEIIRIIDIANDVVKHPTFKHNVFSTGTEVIGLMRGGDIEVAISSDDGSIIRKEINPMKDFKIIRDYLNYIADKQINP